MKFDEAIKNLLEGKSIQCGYAGQIINLLSGKIYCFMYNDIISDEWKVVE